jgi:AcrR family transcriptional regulator
MMTSRTRTAPPHPGKRDKEKRQRSLIDAANAVFAEHGYDAATTRAVAERAGCSEGLIHRYFGGKRGLCPTRPRRR